MPTASEIARRDHDRIAACARERIGRIPVRIEPIPAGLGTRRFYRLCFDGSDPLRLVARVEPGPEETEADGAEAGGVEPAPAWLPEPPLEPLRGFLERAGLPVPRSHAHDPARGLDLLEDVGDRTLLEAPAERRAELYRRACALIPRLQALSAPSEELPAFHRRFDRELVATKTWKWLNWTIPLLLDRRATPHEQAATRRLFERLASLAEAAPMRLAHRDFKGENLHLVRDRVGPQAETRAEPSPDPTSDRSMEPDERLVMIDVQGAFLAPPEYDLVCLLRDLQTDLDEALVSELCEWTRGRLPDRPDPGAFAERFDGLALLRLCKDVSHVVHAGRVRGDRRRWHEVPRGLALIRGAAERLRPQHPEIEVLDSVIEALTRAADPSDIPTKGSDPGTRGSGRRSQGPEARTRG